MAESSKLTRVRWQRIRQEIAEIMDEERPDRYVVEDSTTNEDLWEEGIEECDDGVEWMDRVAESVADKIPDVDVKKRIARDEVTKIERTNLRRGTRHLRDLRDAQQLHLEAVAPLSYPVSVCHRIVKEGERPRIRRERVRIASMTSTDLRLFATEERRRAAKDFATRNETCEAAEWLADEMDEAGDRTLKGWYERQVDTELT